MALLENRPRGLSVSAWLARNGVLEEGAVAMLEEVMVGRRAAAAPAEAGGHLRLVT